MKLIAPLFDFSFSNFISTTIVRVIYRLLVGLAAVASVVGLLMVVLSAGGMLGMVGMLIIGLPVTAIAFLLVVAWARISLEVMIVLFRIAENVQTISDRRPEATASPPRSAIAG